MSNKEWLAGLKAGDPVYVTTGSIAYYRLDRVEKVTTALDKEVK